MSPSRTRNIRDRLRAAAVRELRRTDPTLKRNVLTLEYPPNEHNTPRYVEPHPLLDQMIAQNQDRYRGTLRTIREFSDDLSAIRVHETDPTRPGWINGFLPALDSGAIYSFLRAKAPERYVEVGSGNSTRFAAKAIADGKLRTRIVSIDPHPRAEIDGLCDEVIRAPLESQNLSVWQQMEAGDVVFIDGSHPCS